MTKEEYQNRQTPLLLIAIIGIMAVGMFAAFKQKQVPKTYSVTLSKEQWQDVLQSVDSTNKLLLESDLPTRKSVYASSKLSFLTQTIQMQVGQQIAEEQKAAADTTKRVTKKPK